MDTDFIYFRCARRNPQVESWTNWFIRSMTGVDYTHFNLIFSDQTLVEFVADDLRVPHMKPYDMHARGWDARGEKVLSDQLTQKIRYDPTDWVIAELIKVDLPATVTRRIRDAVQRLIQEQPQLVNDPRSIVLPLIHDQITDQTSMTNPELFFTILRDARAFRDSSPYYKLNPKTISYNEFHDILVAPDTFTLF